MNPSPDSRAPSSSGAFTLVELIVVITILAILGTVGFLSMGNWSSSARDSQRLADVGSIARSFDDSIVTVGSYPAPDNYFTVTYSGWAVWYQGTFSTGALAKLWGMGINKRPLDPLRSTEYVYSSLALGKAYQLKADYESDLALSAFDHGSPFIDTACAAAGNPTIALVRGNYGWLTAKTQTGATIYVLAVPTIVTNTGSAGAALEIKNNVLSWTLLFNGKPLLNASSFNPATVVFSGSALPTSDSGSAITNMMASLKAAYAGSDIASDTNVSTLLSTATGGLVSLGSSIITTQLEGKVTVSSSGGGSSNSCATNPSFANLGTLTTGSPTSDGQAWTYSATPGNCTYTCTAGYSGTSCSTPILAYSSSTTYTASQQFIYKGATVTVAGTGIGTSSTTISGCNTPDIAVWQWGTNNVQIWAACNVGATTTSGYSTVPVQSPNPTSNGLVPPNRAASVQGDYFQWGRNDIVTSGAYVTSRYNGAFANNSTSDTNFYQGDTSPGYGEWYAPDVGNSNPARWNVANGGNSQWPCPSGYHIPTGGSSTTSTEWGILYTVVNSQATFGSCNQSNVYDRTRCVIALPLAGYRHWVDGQYYAQGASGYYWSSSPQTTLAYYAVFYSGGGNIANNYARGSGYSLRCVRN